MSNGIFDNLYGFCYPTCQITYIREYYLIENHRITIDKNITYKLVDQSKIFKDNSFVIEIKADINKDVDLT